jgi:recombination protein RecA
MGTRVSRAINPIDCGKEGTVLPGPEIFPRLLRATDLEPAHSGNRDSAAFSLRALRGRLVELSAWQPAACLSLSATLLLEAQTDALPAAWISTTPDLFYPPDFADNGIDLSILPVIRVPEARAAGRAADWLLRTGAFGLLVVDLYRSFRLSTALQARLAQLAQRHGSTVCFLTVKPPASASLGSMICLYVRVQRRRIAGGRFHCTVRVVKDKRRAPVWEHGELLYGPPGLC